MASRDEDRLVEVDLVEDGALPADPGHDAGGGDDEERRGAGDSARDHAPGTRRPGWWRRPAVLGAAVLVLGAVVVLDVVEARSEAAFRERVDRHTGILRGPLDAPLEEAWSRSGVTLLAAHGPVLAVVQGGVLEGVDVATGETVWRGAERTPAPACEQVATSLLRPDLTASLLSCVEYGGGESTVTLVDVATGEEQGRTALPGAGPTADQLDDLVLLQTTDGGQHHVVAWDAEEAAERWRWSTQARGDRSGVHVVAAPSRDGRLPVTRWVLDEEAGVNEEVPVGWLDRESGAFQPVEGAERLPFTFVVDLADGLQAASTLATLDAVPELRVVDADGVLVHEAEGMVLPPAVDDGDADPLVVQTQEGLDAVDLADGAVLWSRSDVVASAPLARMGDVVLVLTATGMVALDEATGEDLWELTPSDDSGLAAPVGGDGERLLLRREVTPGVELVAVDLQDGTELWTRELGPGHQVHALGGHVVVVGGIGDLTVLR